METTSTRGSTGQLSTSGSTGISGGMHHSMSTPAGVDGGTRTPPATPKKGGKILAMRVQMLDDTVTIFQVQAKADGSVLFEQVCKQLHLLEADYFGLEYLDAAGTRYWLDLQKPLSRQLGLSLVDPLLFFCVKFYTPDPGQLEEEFTRYLFCLQVKRDLSQGYMQCNENTAALMASYIVQAECGDFVPEDYPDHKYLSSYKFVPHQDNELERKIMENHKKHAGQSPAEADLNLLETARRCELYGVKIHPAKDHENVALNLAVAHMGILVFQNYTKINTFSWAKIRKISFKRKRFLIKLHPEGYGYYKDTVEFFFEGRNECKNFWKKCVENHGFFRCSFVKHIPRHKTRVLSRGSSFRYSGKTQKQIIEYVRDNYVKRQAFQRSASFRHSSAHSSASNMNSGGATVGNSISAHPLLPLGDSTLSVEAAKLSASLGSMGRMRSGSPTTRSAYRPPGTATCWTSEPDTRPVPLAEPSPTTNSHSPPLTTQSVTTSPQQRRVYLPPRAPLPYIASGQPPRTDNLNGYTGISTTCTKMPSSPLAKSEGSLDQANPPAFIIHCPSQTQSQYNLGFPPSVHTQTSPDYFYATICNKPKRQVWHRSASCKDLYDFSFEETGQGKRGKRRISPPTDLGERNLESPITRYDDHHSIYSTHSRNNSLEIDQDIIISDHKVYSSSYPGTQSYSQESVEDPGNYDLRDSQEELSHDSYELIEKSDDDSGEIKYRKKPKFNTRSCSLDSGNYIPSDSDSDDIDKHHKCKSSSDVAGDIFAMEDPRDLPREIIPRKSDGSFYKTFKQLSRTSSAESKSDYYEPKAHKSSKESLKKHSSFGSRTSSQESKSDYENKRSGRYDSSQESRSEYYDPPSKTAEVPEFHDHHHEYDRQLYFERNYGTHISKTDNYVDEINRNQYQFVQSPTSHVHSMTVQNVEMPREQNTVPRACKPRPNLKSQASIEREKVTHIWPESIAGLQTEIREWPTTKQSTGEKSTDSESNVFSFDEDRIQSLQNEFDSFGVVPNIDVPVKSKRDFRDDFRDVFGEIEPRMGREPISMHQPIERTKSDPNSLSRQRLSSRRLLLMHQKSIDLTPCESSDDDYLYKQIPSAPPIMKYRDTHFEMPTAEFGHFDIIKREMEGAKTKFEVPKRQFEELGVKAQSDFVNLPPKQDDIPYVLHKRHIMNGTAPSAEIKSPEPVKPKIKSPTVAKESDSQFLFTQNIDLSKVDPVTLEIDKSEKPLQHLTSPKRDITHIDPVMLETLSSKLSQIESDSPTSSRTDSLKPHQKMMLLQKEMQTKIEAKRIDENFATKNEREPEPPKIIAPKVKTTGKPKRIIKPRMQPGKKGGKSSKTKVRITSFSSDDESLDSDDVFGSAEATPTRMEFSPPQMRKEMESILKFESERKYLQYTMSSTEIEGSPPTTRKKVDKKENGLDAIQTELRRISERSISIPSSEDDFNIQTADLQPVFMDVDGLTTVQELEKEDNDKSCDETLREHTLSEDILKNDETIRREEERLREKLMLQAEIENDIKNLRVPSRTKITEITPSSVRKRGQSPLLFAHARLNLSEGSAFSLLQKQQASESPISGRRAISLDAPIIPVSRLPALNAFSSKDDTVEEDDQIDIPTATESEPELPKTPDFVPSKEESDQIVPDVVGKGKKSSLKTTRSRSKEVKSPKPTLPIRGAKALPKSTTKLSPSQRSLPTSLDIPTEIKRTKSQELGETTKTIPKDKSRSLDKEPKRVYSRERSASQEDSDTDIAKRKEKQQMLYEIAIKQTKTIKSPVKDSLPVFPQVEEMVRERHGKLEISINTIENTSVSLEDAIIITKSPKKLDKKIDKLTKSLEINLTDSEIDNWKMQRLGQSLDLDTRSESEPKTEFDFAPDVVAQNKLDDDQHDEVVLEGTSLDVYLSVDEKKYHDRTHLNGIKIIKESKDFCEASTGKPPDIRKLEAKSSSDSQSIEKVSLGNSLDIKYIDDSGDSSYKSENDAALELQKASNTMSKFLKKKLESRKKQIIEHKPSDESLTEVSEIRETPVIDRNFLSVDDATLRLSIERSRSEDTGSWMTVECDEFIGTEESFEYDNTPIASPKEEKPATTPTRTDNTKLQVKPSKLEILQRSSDQSRSSESWTSGEKELSPSGNVKEEESSASVSMGRIIGFSQPVEMFSKDIPHSPSDHEPPRSPRSPRMSIIGRTFTIDEGSLKEDKGETSSDEAYEIPRDLPPITEDVAEEPTSKKPYPFDEKWSSDSELSQRVHQKIIRKLSSNDKSNVSLEDYKDLKRVNGKTPLHSLDKMSTDSKNSVDTESSSGSFGVAARLQKSGDIPKELSSTWKPFPLDSSGSESFDDGFLPADQEINAAAEREYFMCRDTSGDFAQLSDISYKLDDTTPTRDDTDIPDDLAQFSGNFNYPSLTTALGDGISINLQTGFLSRTLSRISERSTNSEKSSVDEESTKASSQSDSLQDETSSNPHASFSSDPPSLPRPNESIKKLEAKKEPSRNEKIPNINNLLQRQISDDRRTSAEMAELSMDDIEIITSERGLKLKRQNSDDTIIDEECLDEDKSNSQESDEWPLPEIPKSHTQKNLLAMHDIPSSDTSQQTTQVYQFPRGSIPKTFGLKGSLKSQDSEQWPSPPSSVVEPPVVDNVTTYYMSPPEEACKVMVDSKSTTYEDDSNSDNEGNRTLDLDTEKTHTYENVATEPKSGSISESLSIEVSGVKIVLPEGEENDSDEPMSNDDVFVDTIESRNELRPPTVMRRSSGGSDDSSHSNRKKSSHSSYSEEDATSTSMTNVENDTVRIAVRPTKCTHSSHSEDTSIALSLSEWSNSTNTVKFQNLSSNSTNKSSSGIKSEENSLTDIAHSVSEWSNSSTMKAQLQSASSMQFQKLSSTSTGDSTLTDLIPTISDWTSSDSTLVPEQFFNPITDRKSISRLGSSIDDTDIGLTFDPKSIQSPRNIPSEDMALFSKSLPSTTYSKSTERPMIIPTLSDTEKSSSSVEQRTVHTQRYDKDKQRYFQKHQTRSTDRPVKAPMKLSKCSPYYSSSLSSESTPLAGSSPIPINKTATVPLMRTHRKPLSKTLFQAKSPPSENDSTSSVESPKSKSERDRRGYRRKRQTQLQRKRDKEQFPVDEYFYVEHDNTFTEYNEYLRNKSMEEMAASFQYEAALAHDCSPRTPYVETLEEGYYPDGDSQSGSDIYRREDDDRFEAAEGFDISLIPPPLLEDDFESDNNKTHI